MNILTTIYSTIVDALFPTTRSERELFSLSAEEAWQKLPKAPTPPIPNTISIFAYKNERVSKLIWNIKYKKSSHAIDIGAYALFQTLENIYQNYIGARQESSSDKYDNIVLIPIPITTRRRRERGFNQCELLLDALAKLDRYKHFVIQKDLLLRQVHVSRQTLKNRQDRLISAKGIFSVNKTVANDIVSRLQYETPSNIRAIIIDDVVTTGSTMREAIDTLKQSGFMNVTGVSLAH